MSITSCTNTANRKRVLQSRSAFTMIEVVVVMGILMIISLGVAQLMKMVSDKQAQVKEKSNVQLLEQSLIPILKDSLNCRCQFSEIQIDPAKPEQIINLEKLNHSCGGSALGFVTTKPAESGQATLVQSIYLTKIKATGNDTEFLATVGIKPLQKPGMMVLKDATAPIKIYTRSQDNKTIIVGCGDVPSPCELPWGGTIFHREKVLAFKSKVAPNCEPDKEERFCEFGTLKGSFQFSNCFNTDCVTPWGERIPLGKNVTAYKKEFAANCEAEESLRTCKGVFAEKSSAPTIVGEGSQTYLNESKSTEIIANSVLQGTGDFPKCSDRKCSGPDGETYYEGQSKIFFKDTESEDCDVFKETRVCHNGVFSGSYTFSRCVPNHCQLPWGSRLNNGQSISAFRTSSADFCDEEKIAVVCVEGRLSYYSPSQSCVSTGCIAPWGEKVRFNREVKAYKVAKAGNCESKDLTEQRVCDKPQILSGSFQYKFCEKLVCSAPWGARLEEGQTITAFQEDHASNCVSEVRTCNEGKLSGSYQFKECKPLTCRLPWSGEEIQEGQSVVAYAEPMANSCRSEIRVCRSGVLSGTYISRTCYNNPRR